MGDIIAIACFIAAFGLAGAAAIEDTRTHLLRNIYTLPIIAIGLLGLPIAGSLNDLGVSAVLGDMAIGAAWFAGPWLITHLIAPKQIGFGDVKLSAGLGLFLGWLEPSLGFRGFFAVSVLFVVFAWIGKSESRSSLPFGPALVGGAIVALLASFV